VAEVAEDVRAAFVAANVALKINVEHVVSLRGERFLLRQALFNLVHNALEFSPEGSEVTVNVKAERERAIFVVEDAGSGVPDYALPRVFERFYSLPRPRSGQKSTGIGLALVREVAHLHGGDVTLENRASGGARAALWIPIGRVV